MSRHKSSTSANKRQIQVGERFGRLTVIAGPIVKPNPTVRRPKRTANVFLCRCDCGEDHTAKSDSLRCGDTLSCGCLRAEKAACRARIRNYRHGFAGNGVRRPAEYNIWNGMIDRCHSSRCKDYQRYSGRGIAVCERWRSSFAAFLEDMGQRPSPQHTIDRIDNDSGYCPENCRWATPKEQAENRRSTVFIEHDGKRLSMTEWSRITGIGLTTICYRLAAGWPVVDVLSKPSPSRRRI